MIFDADERLQDFVKRGDGPPPPVFVGREDVLEDIEETGARAWNPVNRAAGAIVMRGSAPRRERAAREEDATLDV